MAGPGDPRRQGPWIPSVVLMKSQPSGETAAPFSGNSEFTVNPIRRKQTGVIEVSQALLLTTLASFPLLHHAFEGSNPTQTTKRYQNLEIPPNLVLTLQPTPAPRAPLFENRPNKRWIPVLEQPPNLLITGVLSTPISSAQEYPTQIFKRYQDREIPPNLLISGVVSSPITRKFDWPTQTAKRAQVPDQGQTLLLSTLAPSAASLPFAQYDWPTKQSIRYQDREIPPNLVLTFGPTPNFKPIDWPTKQNRWYQNPEILPNLVLTLQPTPAPRAPIFENRPNAKWPIQPDQGRTLLLSTLAPAPSLPFNQTDWPTPKYKFLGPIEQPPNLLMSTMVQQYMVFIIIDDIPKHTLYQFDLFPNLLLTTLSVPPPLPFLPLDWPTKQNRWYQDREQASNLVLKFGPTPNFKPYDWPTQQFKRYQNLEQPPNLLISGNLNPLPPLPHSNYDWPTKLSPKWGDSSYVFGRDPSQFPPSVVTNVPIVFFVGNAGTLLGR